MANSGSGNRFVSVNLNKSYGQHTTSSGSSHSSSGRPRPSGHSHGHGGMLVLTRPRAQVGGQKGSKLAVPPPMNLPSLRREHGASDLAVGHAVGGGNSGSGPGSGSGSGSFGWSKPPPENTSISHDGDQVGLMVDSSAGRSAALSADSTWGAALPPGNTVNLAGDTIDITSSSMGPGIGPNVYMPPAARASLANNGAVTPVPVAQQVEKSVVLRGEDFPSLKASLPHAPMPQQKQKDTQQKQRKNQEDLKEQKIKLQQLSQQHQQGYQDELSVHQQTGSEVHSAPPMRPQLKPRQPQHFPREKVQVDDGSGVSPGQHTRKLEGYSSGPPPLVKLNHTSNWADDERDTGQNFPDRDRERDYSKNDSHCNDNIGYGSFQRNGSFTSLNPSREGRDSNNILDKHYEREFDSCKNSYKGSFRGDSNGRDMWQVGNDRDVSFRKSSAVQKEGNFGNDTGFDRDRGFLRSGNVSRENTGRDYDIENKLNRGSNQRKSVQIWEADNGRENLMGRDSLGKDSGNWDPGSRDTLSRGGGYSQEGHMGNRGRDGLGRRVVEQNFGTGRYGRYGDTFGRSRGLQNDIPQSNAWNKTAFSTGSRGMHLDDPILDFSREKRLSSNHGKPYSEDPFMKDFGNISGFDPRDPFVGGLGTEIKVSRRKKDDSKQTNFYDPIRESFEAELERVQKMQEQERQRMIEEQERAQELVRKEEEERQRLAREEEERQRRLEEEAREASLRAEQEAMETARRLDEERRAREEEKKRIILEEERRKEAARRKLLELEERIAKRQAECKKEEEAKVDDGKLPTGGRSTKDRDGLRRLDAGEWEEEERMVDRITSSASSENSNLSKSFEVGPRTQVSRDADIFASDRTKSMNSWRRESTENGNGSPFMFHTIAAEQSNSNYYSANRESLHGGRGLPRRDLHFEGTRSGSAKILSKPGSSETMQVIDHMPYRSDQRWISSDDSGRHPNVDTEFLENAMDGYAEIIWEQDKQDSWHVQENPRIPFAVPYSQSPEVEEFDLGRSRHSVRQPRVLPPPSIMPLQKGLFKNVAEKPMPSSLLGNEPERSPSAHDSNMESSIEQVHRDNSEASEVPLSQDKLAFQEQQELKNNVQFESHSLLSLSTQPSSPVHVLHDNLEGGESPSSRQDEAEAAAMSHLDDRLGSAEELELEGHVEDDGSASKSVGQEKHEEWVTEDENDFGEEQEYEEDVHLYEEENEVYEKEEDNPEENREYEDLSEEQKVKVHNDCQNTSSNEEIQVEEPVINDFEELVDPDGNKNELQVKHDSSMHQALSFEGELLEVRDHDEHEVHEDEVCETQKEGLIDEKEGSDEVQQSMIQQSIVQQAPMMETSSLASMGASSLASMNTLQVGQSNAQNSAQSLVQPLQHSLSLGSLPSPQSNISSTTTSVGPSILAPISTPSQQEMPIKLQFGLFHGPSILPATVPAIQIGSIQMPLHLHPQVSPSLAQIPPSQPPLFQFGQLRYPAPISQGIIPLTQPPMPYIHPTVPAHYSLGQPALQLSTQHILDSSLQNLSVIDLQQNNHMITQAETVTQVSSSSPVNKSSTMEANTSQENRDSLDNDQLSANENLVSGSTANSSAGQSQSGCSLSAGNEQIKSSKYSYQVEKTVATKVYKPATNHTVLKETGSERGLVQSSSGGYQAVGTAGRGKGSRTIHGVRTSALGLSTNPSEGIWSMPDANRFPKQGRRNIRRSEFRVSVDRRQFESSGSNNIHRQEEKLQNSVLPDSVSGSTSRGAKKDLGLAIEKLVISEVGSRIGYGTNSSTAYHEDKVDKVTGSKAPQKSGLHLSMMNGSRSAEGIFRKHDNSEVADDVPLQSGIVRIFKQSGIETPSDVDDFIEVRSKRQMLNDRREQREKEIKAKSKDLKTKDQAARKQRNHVKPSAQGDVNPAMLHRVTMSSGGERRTSTTPSTVVSESVPFDGRNLPNTSSSASFVASIVSQPLSPIGTPAGNTDGSNDRRLISSKSIQASPVPAISHGDADAGKGLRFENQSLGQDNITGTNVGAWGSTRSNQQVVSLTQIQLEEAMKPPSFESKRAPLLPLGDCSGLSLESGLSVTSMLAQDKPLSSGTGPLNSLLAGEKIQFGAVTSPTLLPPGSCSISRAVSTGLGHSVPCRPDTSRESSLSTTESDSTSFFNKTDDRCRQIVDPEAEAEAAASAVAVAAISSDESIGSGLGGIAMSVAETKGFGNSDVGAAPVGISTTRPAVIQTRGEESMTVSLPADLSLETPSLSLWPPPVPNRQSPSGPVLPHFPGAPSHFPCFEMSPMLGGRIFALGQHEEATSLSQGQNCSTSVEQGLPSMGTGPVGGWQPCHSGVDSYYGAPSGFTGPFISPPGMQGPPPMVLYTSPFAPVGQFGQLGLSFMGTAYIPSGKQPDWKHTPVSTSGVGLNEADIGSLGMISAQRNPNMSTPVQHMPSGTSLMPMVQPLGLFDMNLSSPFQSSADLPMQTQWSHVPGAPQLHSMPMSGPMVNLSMPLQQTDGISTQLSHPPHTIESAGSRFHQVLASKTTSSVPFSSVDAAAQFPDELGLGDSVSNNNSSVLPSNNIPSNRTNYSSVSSANIKVQKSKNTARSARSSSTGTSVENSALALGTNTGTSSSQSLHGSRAVGSPFQSQGSAQQTSVQYPHPIGYMEQRGTTQQQMGHKTSAANEWSGQSHRKIGGQGRSQMSGEKNFTTTKTKQVYVVKPSSSPSNVGNAVTLL